MTKAERRRRGIARRIVRKLFTNGQGERASRLVLELGDRGDGGEWCEAAAYDQVLNILREPKAAP